MTRAYALHKIYLALNFPSMPEVSKWCCKEVIHYKTKVIKYTMSSLIKIPMEEGVS